jgi:hypothetical protein
MNLKRVLTVAGLTIGLAGLSFAASEGGHDGHVIKHRFVHGMGVEQAAMHNVLAELVSAKTGKSVAEVQAAFDQSHPHEAMEQLGLTEDDMKPLFKQAHEKLVAKAQAAGLITAAQAEKIRSQPHKRIMRHPSPPPAPDSDE